MLVSVRILEISIGGFRDKFLLYTAAALLVTWPSGIIHSVRIGNDSLLYPIYALSALYLVKWDALRSWKYLLAGAVLAGLAVITKVNAIAIMCVLGLIYLFELYRGRKSAPELRDLIKKGALIFFICLAGLFIALGRNIPGIINKSQSNLIVANLGGLDSRLRVGNFPSNYIYFDGKVFLTEPFTSAWDDTLGRQYFWNYLFKTSLFGEFDYSQPLAKSMAMIISFLFLLIAAYSIAGLFLTAREEILKHRVLLLNFLILIIAAIAYRIMAPYSCCNDFRFIFPILIPFCFMFAHSTRIYRIKGRTRLAAAGIAAGILFILCNTVFFISLLF
jgi:hypothetical protein